MEIEDRCWSDFKRQSIFYRFKRQYCQYLKLR